jgi:hypothetical protein
LEARVYGFLEVIGHRLARACVPPLLSRALNVLAESWVRAADSEGQERFLDQAPIA